MDFCQVKKLCVLCELEMGPHPIIDEQLTFCCHGCHTVYKILASKNQLVNFQENPLFLQAVRSGLISNPALIEQLKKNRPEVAANELEKIHFEVADMWCPSCAEIIRLILLQQKGVRNCVVDYATDLASIEFAPRYVSKETLFNAIRTLGYQVVFLEDAARKAVSFSLYLRFIVAAFCALNVMMFAYPLYATHFDYDPLNHGATFAWLSCILALPVLFYSAWPIFRRFYNSLKVGIFGMETLVVLGISSSFILSIYELYKGTNLVYFDSMTVIIAFVLLGKIIEAKAKFSTKDSLLRLSRSIPRRGRKRFPDQTEAFVSAKELQPGDLIVALTGEKIVLDGVVVEGEGSCDESLMTGEALPVFKKAGSGVLGGTVLQNGRLFFKVTSTPDQSALHRIITMVEQDIGHKSIYLRAVDPIVHWFVPFVLVLALITVAFTLYLYNSETAFERALAVILISCPCAIGIAAPLAESYLMNGLANLGAIVRNRGCLSALGKETVFVFDKTGTITEGHFTVLGGLNSLAPEQLAILKGMATQSTHPICYALAQGIQGPIIRPHKIEEFAGKGLRVEIDSDVYLLGSQAFTQANSIETRHTAVNFCKNGNLLSTILLGDRIKDGANELIAHLAPSKTVLLSGDAHMPVAKVAKACGFDHFQAGLSPLQKKSYIDDLRASGEVVCMLGDGINDAPALTAANVGISVVTATDISIQVSDILLTTDRLGVIPEIFELARRGRKIIKQNLFWAFFYNAVGIGFAMVGYMTPIFATAAMMCSSIIVLFNAKRLEARR